MSDHYRGGAEAEEENGMGWGGLVPTKAEREQERREAATRLRIAELEAIAKRYRWLTAHAYIGACFTDEGVILEVHGTDRRVPIAGTVDEAIDAAMLKARKA